MMRTWWQKWTRRPSRAIPRRRPFGVKLNLETLESRTVPSLFNTAPTLPVGGAPDSVAVADFNNDGHMDMVVANKTTNNVSVFINKGDGTFFAPVNYSVSTGPVFVTTADLGNGRSDIITADSSGFVSVLLNNGDGTFANAVNISVGNNPDSVTAVALTSSGRLDLVSANSSGTVSAVLNNGDGTFKPAVSSPAGSNPLSITGGDFNHDGKGDVAVVSGGKVNVLLGNGDGTFQAPVSYAAGPNPVFVTAAAFTASGNLDLAVANGSPSTYGVAFLSGNADGTFNAAVEVNVGGSPASLATGDFNGDGKLDLASANGANNSASVVLGNGDGTFGPATVWGADQNPVALAAGDLNGDGKQDLAVVNLNSNNLSLLLGHGDGTFAAAQFSTGVSKPGPVAVGDFRRDGKLDLVIGSTPNPDPTTVSILLGNGDGTFQAPIHLTGGGYPRELAVADVNGDGKLDIITLTPPPSPSQPGTLAVFLGNGDGTFQAATTFSVSNGAWDMAVGDFSGSGFPDIAIANNPGAPVPGTVSIYHNNGHGSFALLHTYNAGVDPVAITAADLGNGHLDLAVANNNGPNSTVTILVGHGDGTFSPSVGGPYLVAGPPTAVAAGDFNGDGKLDLAVATFPNFISVLLNRGDGTFNAATNYTVGPNPTTVVVGDFNGDGKLDLASVDHNSNTVTVLTGNGQGSFQLAEIVPVGTGPVLAAAADLTGAGNQDLVVTANLGDSVTTLLATQMAVHFQVTAQPTSSAAGSSFTVTVTAEDSSNHTITSYQGTVTFTSTDPQAAPRGGLPADYTFKATDNGTHSFTVTLYTAGPQSVTVTDKSNSAVTGAVSVTITPSSNLLFHLTATPSTVDAGTNTTLTVSAVDQYGNPITNYTGTILLTSTDSSAVWSDTHMALPVNYSFTVTDHGNHSFHIALGTPGSESLTATDTANQSMTGTTSVTVNATATATHFRVTPATTFVIGGLALPFTVTALDASNNPVPTYHGTLHFGSSDTLATLPADTIVVNGSGSFIIVLRSPGTQTFFASDFVASTITGSATVTVAEPVEEVFVVGLDNQIYSQMLDSSGNPIGSYILTQPGQVLKEEVGHDASGRPVVFVLGLDNQVYEQTFDANGHSTSGYMLVAPMTIRSPPGS
jgi:hypothetical protein